MRQSNQKKGLKGLFVCAFIIYLVVVLYITILSRPAEERRFDMEPFNSYVLLFRDKNYFYLYQSVCNIAMTIPLGILLPLISEKFHSLRKVILTGFIFSCCIESAQYITCRGLCEFDDLFNNTAGAAVGYFLFLMIYILVMSGKRRK